ncbi:DUF6418 domain-containing protein [Thiohalocapsa sp. ML1]|jgi:hypothetical protein|uniref:DUF6418 domain-containing protein n=1 Tax=Thiohalocapsa sp. ML1 TaxID=1431688 RepID=UPI0007321B14|nr:DUF6418 domain-containing protein [Thiohalocapsa sp. ML1]
MHDQFGLISVLYAVLLVLMNTAALSVLARRTTWLPGVAWLLFNYSWMVVSNIVLEGERQYITEQMRYSLANGATLLLLGYTALFLAGYFIGAAVLDRYVKRAESRLPSFRLGDRVVTRKQTETAVFWIIVATLLVLIGHALVSGSPVFNRSVITQQHFWDDAARVPALAKVYSQLPAVAFAFAVVSTSIKRTLIVVVLCIVSLALVGDNFSAMFFTTYFGLFRALQHLNLRSVITPRAIAGAAAFVSLFVWLTIMGYQSEGRQESAAINFMFYRSLVLQGHVWWGLVDYVREFGPVGDAWHLLENDGMDTAMKIVAPASIYGRFAEGGGRFTGAYPGVLHLSFGAGAMVLQVLVGALFAFVVLTFHYVARLGFVCAFLAAKVFQYVIIFLVMGDSGRLFALNPAVYSMLLMFFVLMAVWLRSQRFGQSAGGRCRVGIARSEGVR